MCLYHSLQKPTWARGSLNIVEVSTSGRRGRIDGLVGLFGESRLLPASRVRLASPPERLCFYLGLSHTSHPIRSATTSKKRLVGELRGPGSLVWRLYSFWNFLGRERLEDSTTPLASLVISGLSRPICLCVIRISVGCGGTFFRGT